MSSSPTLRNPLCKIPRNFPQFLEEFYPAHRISTVEAGVQARVTHASVLLAWFCGANASTKVRSFVEAGCGTGFVSFALARWRGWTGVGIDMQPSFAVPFEQGAQQNGVEQVVSFVQADVSHLPKAPQIPLADVLACNPPHFFLQRGRPYGQEQRRDARSLAEENLPGFVAGLARLLKNRGEFFLVLPAVHGLEWIDALHQQRMVPKNMVPVYGRVGKTARLVLLKGSKNANRGFVQIEPPVFLRG
ncbi:MAG TPA: methyltransferase domain-containing protein [Thermotogota bacterium]|nr:methyltransferase domain-containing protein [Thermotogota bacterium]